MATPRTPRTLRGPHRKALGKTIATDDIVTDDIHAGLLQLARSRMTWTDRRRLAPPRIRTLATYAGSLNAIRLVIKDARETRHRNLRHETRSGSRLAAIQQSAKRSA